MRSPGFILISFTVGLLNPACASSRVPMSVREPEPCRPEWPPLLCVVEKGDRAAARRLLQRGADANETGEDQLQSETVKVMKRQAQRPTNKETILHDPFDALCGKLSCLPPVLENSPPLFDDLPVHQSALILAAQQGDDAMVALLLKHGADVHYQNGCGDNALKAARYGNHSAVEKLLLDAGAENTNFPEEHPCYRNAQGIQYKVQDLNEYCFGKLATAAFFSHQWDVLDRLIYNKPEWVDLHFIAHLTLHDRRYDSLRQGFSWLLKQDYGKAILRSGQGMGELVQRHAVLEVTALLDEGADPNLKDPEGRSMLQLAVQGRDLEMAQLLIARGADISFPCKSGYHPIVFAANNQDEEMFFLLAGNRIDNVIIDEWDNTLLHVAALFDLSDVVSTLLEGGADPGARNHIGFTPVSLAARYGAVNALRAFFLNDPNLLDRDVGEPLSDAAEDGHRDCYDLVLAHEKFAANQRNRIMAAAVKIGDENTVRRLLAEGVNPKGHACQRGNTIPGPMPGWVENSDTKSVSCDWIDSAGSGGVVDLLAAYGADVNYRDANGRIGLRYLNNLDVAKALIRNGIDVNATDGSGETLLMRNVEPSLEPDLSIARLLVESGANVNAVNQAGDTPLIVAAKNCAHLAYVQLLISHGAIREHRNKDGLTARDAANAVKCEALVNVLGNEGTMSIGP